MASLSGLKEAKHVVDIQNMFAPLYFLEDGQQPVFPLADVGHARDQALRRQQPDILAIAEWRSMPADATINEFMDQGRLAGLSHANQQYRASLLCFQQAR